jgi:agmatinase
MRRRNAIDLLRIVRRLILELDVVGFDVMEVAPAYDRADVTVNNAHRLIWEFFGAKAKLLKEAGQ